MSQRLLRGALTAIAIVFALTSFVTPILMSEKASAAVWDDRCFNGADRRTCGYFLNRYNYLLHGSSGIGASHSYVLRNGVSGNTANEFLASINGYRNNTANDANGRWDRAGAAFIVHTVLGRSGDQANAAGGRSISAADWASFEARIRGASINFNAWVCANGVNTVTGVNPARDSTTIDVSRSNDAAVMYACDAGISITDASGNQYNLIRNCANPAGRMDEIADPGWSINAQSYIRKDLDNSNPAYSQPEYDSPLIAAPGDRIEFAHDLRAKDGDIGSTIYYTIRSEGFPEDFRQKGQQWSGLTTIQHGWVDPVIDKETLFVNYNANGLVDQNTSYMLYDIRQSDVGNKLCQRIEYGPTSSSNSDNSATTFRCVSVPYNYTLAPSIVSSNITEGNVVESNNTPLPVDGIIRNTGITKSRTDVEWQLTQVEYSVPLASITNKGGGAGSGSNPCAYFTGNVQCRDIESDIIVDGIASGGSFTTPNTINADISNKPVGTKICFALSVRPYNQNQTGNTWSHSALRCIVVGKKPKVQVLGGDLLVGRPTASNPAGANSMVRTSVNSRSGTYYGSWVEYGLAATGCVFGMASGSGYVGGVSNLNTINRLTFSSPGSTASGCARGGYAQVTAAPNIAARFPINVTAATASPTRPADPAILPSATINIASLSGDYQAPAGVTNLTINGGTIAPGRWVVINAPGATIRIVGNITYTPAVLSSIAQIPQVILIGQNILVQDNVTQVDAWLVASGSGASGVVNTCVANGNNNTTFALRHTDCVNKLTVNGPVVANHLLLRRTAGSGLGAQISEPAEVFNLRADAYIWAANYNTQTGRLSTAEIKELPPRY